MLFILILPKFNFAQTQVFAKGTITGGIISSGPLAGSPIGLSRTAGGISTAGDLISIFGIPNPSANNFYYAGTIKTTLGAPTTTGSSSILNNLDTIPILLQANKSISALVTVAGANSFVQFRYLDTVTRGTTSYIKLKEKPIRSSTLDVAALGVLSLASTKIVVGELYSGALQPQNVTLGTVSQNTGTAIGSSGSLTVTRLLIDKYKDWYAAIVPAANVPYNSVRLTAQFPSDLNVLSLANSISVNIYSAFTESSGGACSVRPRFTNEGEGVGINLNTGVASDLLDLSQIVANPSYAIDDNQNSYSAISSGIASVGVLNSISQTFYFDHISSTNDGVHIKMALNNSLLSLSLVQLNNIKFQFYKGVSEIPDTTLGMGNIMQLLGLNLLNLLNIGSTHKEVDINFIPGVTFDRVKVVFDASLLGVGLLSDALRIYDVSLSPSLPKITSNPVNDTACSGSSAAFNVNATGTALTYQWQKYTSSSWLNYSPGGTSTTLNIPQTNMTMNGDKYKVIVTGGITQCLQSITSPEVYLNVLPIPLPTPIFTSFQ